MVLVISVYKNLKRTVLVQLIM